MSPIKECMKAIWTKRDRHERDRAVNNNFACCEYEYEYFFFFTNKEVTSKYNDHLICVLRKFQDIDFVSDGDGPLASPVFYPVSHG